MKAIFKHAGFITIVFLLICSCKRDDRGMVVGKIHKASKLSTTEFTIDKIVHGTKTKKLAWVVNLNEARFLAYSRAIVKAGIDLKKISQDDVKIEKKSIQVKLPAVEIINFSYPPKFFEMDKFISDDAFLNKISIYDQEKFFRDAEVDIRNNLKYMGIVETTEEKTRVLLTGVLKTLGYDDIQIAFTKDKLIEEIPFTEQFER